MTPVPWKQWEGQTVDSLFPLRRYLGGTDHSVVYLTEFADPEPRQAAIKLLLAENEETDSAVPWDRAARLSHPNLLPLLRTGRWQANQLTLRYVVTEYAEENLGEVIADRALTADEARDMWKPLLEALSYLHSEGLVHGHVKPSNILAAGDTLKLPVDGVTLVGEPGTTPCTPGPYDPPEFCERGASPVGDVWSLGVTMVQATTQRFPVAGGPKQDPSLPENLPAEFLPAVRACLRADPRRRATIDQVLELLAHPESAAPVQAAQPAIPSQPAPRATRKWISASLAATAAIALAAILFLPRALHHPVASAQNDPPAAVSSPAAAPTPVTTPAPEKPTPFGTPGAAKARAEKAPAPKTSSEESHVATVPAEKPPAVEPPKSRTESSSGEVLNQVMPAVPDYARRTIRGKVKVQVRATVDASGHVSDAKVESQNSRYFAKLALAASRQWEFAPGPANWILHYEFTTAGATVRPSKLAR